LQSMWQWKKKFFQSIPGHPVIEVENH
jgi:hypothetical protein